MARRKRSSIVIIEAQERLAGIKSIAETLDLGNGISVAEFTAKIENSRNLLEKYNTSLSIVDENGLMFDMGEKDLKTFHELILKAVGVKYGFDSPEYKMAGGTMKSERKKPVRNSKLTE